MGGKLSSVARRAGREPQELSPAPGARFPPRRSTLLKTEMLGRFQSSPESRPAAPWKLFACQSNCSCQ